MSRALPEGSLISYFSTLVKTHGGINLAQGLPGIDPPLLLLDILSQVAHEPIHQYPPGIGNLKLLDLLVNYYRQFLNVERDHFLITQGATEAISLIYLYILKSISNPFSVMSFTPAYESYVNLPRHFGQQFFEIPYDISADELKQTIRRHVTEHNARLFFVASPGNPFGRSLSQEIVGSIIQTCSELNCFVIFDAVYKEIYFEQPPYMPYDLLNEHVFYVNSFSKLLSITGWRVGYIIADKKHMKGLRQLHDYTGLCTNSVAQEAIARYIQHDFMGFNYVKKARQQIAQAYRRMKATLQELGFTVPEVDGGYFIWAQLPSGFDDGFDTALQLYERERIATVPGIHFTPYGKNYIRFSIARKSDEIDAAIHGLKNFFVQTR